MEGWTASVDADGIADDMVASGLAASLARSGGNTTGVSILSTELGGKRQELPHGAGAVARRIVALFDPATNRTRNFKKW